MKAILKGILIIAVIFAVVILWNHSESPISKELNDRIEEAIASKGRLDLTTLNSEGWNEILIVTPYASTEDFSDYQGPKISSSDDGEMYFVFLKDKAFVDSVKINRSKIDFASCTKRKCQLDLASSNLNEKDCTCPKRLPRDKAVFWVDYQKDGFRHVSVGD